MFKKNNKSNQNKTFKDCASFINMPISFEDDDKIGIHQYALEIKDAIKKGAQTIAITSDFGGGKSSLVKYLESLYCKFTTKFCYINLWCDLDNTSTAQNADSQLLEIHKSFIYQLASQISNRKGKYISKRLSKNYGLIKLTLQNAWLSVLSYIMFALIIAGMMFIPLYDNIQTYISNYKLITDNHNEIGIACFCLAILIGLLLIYRADIVFSAKQSDSGREINEHELMDIYKSYICNYHFKHYIVIIEDLDRTQNINTERFIKELRRYYVPCKNNLGLNKKANNRFEKIGAFNRNRITFIVNIKSESALDVKSEGLYPKVFDYILNLKTINIDNYDVILKKFLMDNKHFFIDNDIPIFTDDEKIIADFEWLKLGTDLDIRRLKTRLNSAISTYVNLRYKFDKDKISLSKCIAYAYITEEFSKDYIKIEKVGFDGVIDIYVKNHKLEPYQVLEFYKVKGITISVSFAVELIRLITQNLIDSDYKQYFYNYPIDSYLHSNDETKLINILLYDTDVSTFNDFNELVENILKNNHMIVFMTFKRLKNLSAFCPRCIFHSNALFDYVIKNHSEMVWNTIENNLLYDDESISATSKILINIIKNHFLDNSTKLDRLCKIIIAKGTPHAIISFRKSLIETFPKDIVKFHRLFGQECPLITKSEIISLRNIIDFITLINYDSVDFNIDLVETIQKILLTEFDIFDAVEEKHRELITSFYVNTYNVLGEAENEKLTKYIFEFCIKNQIIIDELEQIVIENNNIDNIYYSYTALLCIVAKNQKLSANSLQYIDDYDIINDLNEQVCEQLYENSFFKSYIVNACAIDINLVNFKDEKIIETINLIDFQNDADNKVSNELLFKIRSQVLIISEDFTIANYKNLFFAPNPLINDEELNMIYEKEQAIKLIDSSQIENSSCEFISDYLNVSSSPLNTSYYILQFVSSIDDIKIKRDLFTLLDFNTIQYCRISGKRKTEIKKNMSDTFDFSKLSEQIEYMTITKSSDTEFEKQIKAAISSNIFKDYEQKYVDYVCSLKRINNETINNLCNLKIIYTVTPLVQQKLFSCKKYYHYVCGKTKYDQHFTFEKDKLSTLSTVYTNIFISPEASYPVTKPYMAENSEFVEYLIEQKAYKDTSEYNRKMFTNALQSVESLKDLFENYDSSFIVEYLSKIKGFNNKEAAEYCISKIKYRKEIAASDAVYENIYEKLVDFILKGKYTRYHNNAKKKN